MENEEITIVIAEQDLEEIINYELGTIVQTDVEFDPNPGRTPLCPREFAHHDHKPEDTLANMLAVAPIRMGV